MSRTIDKVVIDIDRLAEMESDDLDLERLQALADEYFTLPDASTRLAVWFRLYERHPDSDGNGIFWSILHGLENHPECLPLVVESVRRRPTHFPVLMVNRLLNGGIRTVEGVDLVGLLKHVRDDSRSPSDIRKDAKRFLERHVTRSD